MYFNEVSMFFKNKMNIVALYNLHIIQVELSALYVHNLYKLKSQICYRILQIAYPFDQVLEMYYKK